MIDKRLLKEMSFAKHYVYKQVLMQWISLLCSIILVMVIATLLVSINEKNFQLQQLWLSTGIVIISLIIRMFCIKKASMYAHVASCGVKDHMRERLYQKILQLKNTYQNYISTSELMQLNVEGIDQLETYFGRYLPQFYYSMLAPFTLFLILVWFDLKSSLLLLFCVPLIPLSIVAVQKIAKKLLAKYWTSYASLGDRFLESLQGLITLKIYDADEYVNKKMNEEAETFRKITMKVLTMQLNSVSVMDIIAYGGAALGSILAIIGYMNASIHLFGVICIVLLSAEFFIPLRLLGSYFHIAMNGIAACDKIFRILDIEIREDDKNVLKEGNMHIKWDHVDFAYDESRTILRDICFEVKHQQFIGIVGESGSGKSTMAKLIAGFTGRYQGSIQIQGLEQATIRDCSFYDYIAYITHKPVIFKGTLRENLIMGKQNITDEECYKILNKVCLKAFVEERGGLDMPLTEDGQNLSGGQKQRISIARSMLADRELYIFDEATSNIDVESEQTILCVIKELMLSKTVIMITHRLQNVVNSDCIYVLQKGACVEKGTHAELMKHQGVYETMFTKQYAWENIQGELNYA